MQNQTPNQLRILVIDDSPIHRAAAEQQLAHHQTMVVGSYDEAEELLMERYDPAIIGGMVRPEYDVVLTDLLLPAGTKRQGPTGQRFVGQEMPIGVFLALRACQHGVPLVGVLTDSNHHDHPASACIDWLKPMCVGSGRLIFSNSDDAVASYKEGDYAVAIKGPEAGQCTSSGFRPNPGFVRAKNWAAFLMKVQSS